jgi:mRNA interferase MazF
MKVEVGEIYWVKVDSNFRHPALVIEVNASKLKVILITTNAKKLSMLNVISLEAGEGGLEKSSIVETYKSKIIDSNSLSEFIGRLSNQRIDEITNALVLSENLIEEKKRDGRGSNPQPFA